MRHLTREEKVKELVEVALHLKYNKLTEGRLPKGAMDGIVRVIRNFRDYVNPVTAYMLVKDARVLLVHCAETGTTLERAAAENSNRLPHLRGKSTTAPISNFKRRWVEPAGPDPKVEKILNMYRNIKR